MNVIRHDNKPVNLYFLSICEIDKAVQNDFLVPR